MKNLPPLMESAGLNQTTLAKAAGLHAPQINNYLNGKGGPPKLENLEAIADALGVSVAGLLGEEAPLPRPAPEERLRVEAMRGVLAADRDMLELVLDTLKTKIGGSAARKNRQSSTGA